MRNTILASLRYFKYLQCVKIHNIARHPASCIERFATFYINYNLYEWRQSQTIRKIFWCPTESSTRYVVLRVLGIITSLLGRLLVWDCDDDSKDICCDLLLPFNFHKFHNAPLWSWTALPGFLQEHHFITGMHYPKLSQRPVDSISSLSFFNTLKLERKVMNPFQLQSCMPSLSPLHNIWKGFL